MFISEVSHRVRRYLKNHWHYILVACFGLILSIGIFGGYNTYIIGDDYAFHVERLQGAAHALHDGQIFMQVDPDAMYGFGYAYNLFYGPLLTWIAAFSRIFINSWPIIINSICVLLMLLSGITACYAIMRINNKASLAALIGIIYMAAPYHLANLYVRFAIAEFASMAVLPILFLGLYQLVHHQRYAMRHIIIAAVFLLLTHNIMTLLCVIFALMYLVLNIRSIWNIRSVKQIIVMGLIILGGSACFLLPFFEAKISGNYGIFDSNYSSFWININAESVNSRHIPLANLVIADYDNLMPIEDNYAIGLISLIGIVGFWFVIGRCKTPIERKMLSSLYIISLISLILTTSLIKWEWLPSVLYTIQFPWRFLAIFSFTISIISGYIIYELVKSFSLYHQKLITLIIGLVIVYPVANLFISQPDMYYQKNLSMEMMPELGSVGWAAEYAPMALLCESTDSLDTCGIERTINYLHNHSKEPQVISENATIHDYKKEGTNINFILTNDFIDNDDITIEVPLIWYPGYGAYLNHRKIKTSSSGDNGFVSVSITKEELGQQGIIEIRYTPTALTIVGFTISFITNIGCICWLIVSRKRRKYLISS